MDEGAQKAVVMEFGFRVSGRTREECTDLADKVAREVFAVIGGEPWVMLDDDWKRHHISAGGGPGTLADDQGFYYNGVRKYQFNGPWVERVTQPTHDGFRTQKQVEGE